MKETKLANALKIISGSVILVILLGLLAACGGEPEANTGGAGDLPDADSDIQGGGEAENQGEEKILPNLPALDFGGHTFNILTFGVQGSHEWENIDLNPELDEGNVIGDAVFRRNAVVESKYNITLNQVHRYDDDFRNALRNEVRAGTNEYDLFSPRVIESAGFMQDGFFMNLFSSEIEHLDLDKPWYNQQAIAEMSIDNRLFILLSDILLSDNNATTITVFNKKILQDHGLGDPYSLVREGKWTVDKLYEMAKETARFNNNGLMHPSDSQFGYLIWGDAMISYLHSAGQRLVSKDENDLPFLSFNNQQTYTAMDKVMDLLYDEDVTGNVQKALFSDWSDLAFENIFSDNRAAFGWLRLGWVPRLRGMDADFGILPIPKIYESNDTMYYSTVNVHTSCALAIPINSAGKSEIIERTTVIMEALAAESKYTLTPAYYDVSLRTKGIRDDESSEMLDIILANRVLDIGDVYNFADFGIEFYRRANNNDRALATFYERNENRVNRQIDLLIDKIQNLD
ncbi:MAG: hypothetical protein FWH10_00390 [Oscillospiraceae bacterium]|nr:hypothetical protein [Oscillospiraceae bacterium]